MGQASKRKAAGQARPRIPIADKKKLDALVAAAEQAKRKFELEVARAKLPLMEAAHAAREFMAALGAAHGFNPAAGFQIQEDGTVLPPPPAAKK